MTKLVSIVFILTPILLLVVDSLSNPEFGAKLGNLTCYVCDSFADNETCIDVNPNKTKVEICPEKYLFCAVREFSFLKNGTTKLWYLQRNCTDKCEEYCLGMGERIRLFSCTKCCTKDLCNFGSGSHIFTTPNCHILLFFLLCSMFTK